MDELSKIRRLYELKKVNRYNLVGDRPESSAEHSWSCLMLADYFLAKTKLKLDRLKIYELLMYHDVVEIEAGDTPIFSKDKHLKMEKEKKAAMKLKHELPVVVGEKFTKLFKEFEEGSSTEARFAKAIDSLDVVIQVLDKKEWWKDWSEEMVRGFKQKPMEGFPEIKKLFEEIMIFVKENNYFG